MTRWHSDASKGAKIWQNLARSWPAVDISCRQLPKIGKGWQIWAKNVKKNGKSW